MERWKKSQLFAMNHLGRADLALSKKKKMHSFMVKTQFPVQTDSILVWRTLRSL